MKKILFALLVVLLTVSFAYASHCPIGDSCATNAACGNPGNNKYICSTTMRAGVHSCVCGASGCEDAYTPDANDCGTSSECSSGNTQLCTRTGSCGQFDPTIDNYGCFTTCTTCTGGACSPSPIPAACSATITPTPTAYEIPTDVPTPTATETPTEAPTPTDVPTPTTSETPTIDFVFPSETPMPSDGFTAGEFEAPTSAPYDYSGFATNKSSSYSTAISMLFLAALAIAGYTVMKEKKA